MPIYIFDLRGSEDAPTGLEAFELADDAAAVRKAGDLLDEHPSCDHVEVWNGEHPVVARHRGEPGLRALPSKPSVTASARPGGIGEGASRAASQGSNT